MEKDKISEAGFYKGLYDAIISKNIGSLLKLAYSIWQMPISMIDIDYNVLGMHPVKSIGDSTYDFIIKSQKISKNEKQKFIDERYLLNLHMCRSPFTIDWGIASDNNRYAYKLECDGIMYGAVSMVLLNSYRMTEKDAELFMKISEAAAKILSSSSQSVQNSATSRSLIIRFLLTGVEIGRETAGLYLDQPNIDSTVYRLMLGTSPELESPFYGEDLLKRLRIQLPDAYINILDNRIYTVLQSKSSNDIKGKEIEKFTNAISKFGEFRIFASDAFTDITHLKTYKNQVDFLSTLPYANNKAIVEYKDNKLFHIVSFIPADIRSDMISYSRLSKLKAYDEKYNTDLMETLRIYSKSIFNSKKTSDILNIHRNTLLNRLNRIEQIASISLDEEKDMLDIMLYFILDEYGEMISKQKDTH